MDWNKMDKNMPLCVGDILVYIEKRDGTYSFTEVVSGNFCSVDKENYISLRNDKWDYQHELYEDWDITHWIEVDTPESKYKIEKGK